nr:hypothetical protein GCM10020092_079930 [Actinoplanes digitatis]
MPSRGGSGSSLGASLNTYLLFNLLSNRNLVEALGPYQTQLANDKDFLATRASYKLGLRGPSITVQTACSTSLVAVHLACQSLLSGESDIVLAGGISINVPLRNGYLYQQGGILSPDGHCRPFDAAAKGTVIGNGVALVVLRRLADAREQGDIIDAVIRGSAVNNDGALKVGYTAPPASRARPRSSPRHWGWRESRRSRWAMWRHTAPAQHSATPSRSPPSPAPTARAPSRGASAPSAR